MKYIISLFLIVQIGLVQASLKNTDSYSFVDNFTEEIASTDAKAKRAQDSIAALRLNTLLNSREYYSDSNIVKNLNLWGLYKVKRNGKYGYITDKKVVVPAIYDKIGDFECSKKDKELLSYTYDELIIVYNEIQKNLKKKKHKHIPVNVSLLPSLIIWVKQGDANYFIGIDGKFILPNFEITSKINEKFWDYE